MHPSPARRKCGKIGSMGGNRADDCGIELTRVNKPGLSVLREYLTSGQAVAFLGAGASAPLYPLWAGLIGELVDSAAGRMSPEEAATCRGDHQLRPGHRGRPAALDAAAEALACAETTGNRRQIQNSHVYLGWLAGLADDAAEAEKQFTTADQIEVADGYEGAHLYSLAGAGGRTGWPAPGGPVRPACCPSGTLRSAVRTDGTPTWPGATDCRQPGSGRRGRRGGW